ncbi:heparin-sulfate lyase HepC [Bacteroides sp.]|uniref:heparin-sulfate lyase HepC n=1 Tax=Bacteroides sp. TaxID=29523 RepID=UPI0011DDBBA1|nr:heparin-sulfate lyase HepC [Bacteroides sp.]
MKKIIFLLLCTWLLTGHITKINARTGVNEKIFSLLNLDYPGLEQVKALYQAQKKEEAAQALLNYYRERKHIHHPDINLENIQLSPLDKIRADNAMQHIFYGQDGYEPTFYGKDINWKYWPIKDNEIRWMLHRHKWFIPMGYAYRVNKDEKYAKEWIFQYMDWIKKNPLLEIPKEEYEILDNSSLQDETENNRFAWRPLEVSERLQGQLIQFLLFLPAQSFTPDFLTEFLWNYHRHATFLSKNYSEQGNHLLFEAQRMFYAGTFFPEFKEASEWRKSGIDILNHGILQQVYPDGGQYELDPHYHLATINIFYSALNMGTVNGFQKEFPQNYIDTIERMIMFYANICFPDYSNPCFSDALLTGKQYTINCYKKWSALFPDNQVIRYFATEGKEGTLPDYLSKGFTTSGFFIFRNSWGKNATQMVVKAGPKGEWHCQPDNGTFELWFNGKNLFPDSGSYVFAGDEEVMKLRNWFRSTSVHNTLTLNNQTIEATESVTKLWKPEGKTQILVTENPSYKDLRHRRSVFFVDNSFFVIVDEAIGKTKGTVNLHYQLCEGRIKLDTPNMSLTTVLKDKSNVKLQCFGPKGMKVVEEEGWYSIAYRQRAKRPAISFNVEKKDDKPVRYITIIYPFKDKNGENKFDIRFKNKSFNEKGLEVEVKVNGKSHILGYKL